MDSLAPRSPLSVASACPTAKWFNVSGTFPADTPATTAFSIQVARTVRSLRRPSATPRGCGASHKPSKQRVGKRQSVPVLLPRRSSTLATFQASPRSFRFRTARVTRPRRRGVAAPSQMEQPADAGGGRSQLDRGRSAISIRWHFSKSGWAAVDGPGSHETERGAHLCVRMVAGIGHGASGERCLRIQPHEHRSA